MFSNILESNWHTQWNALHRCILTTWTNLMSWKQIWTENMWKKNGWVKEVQWPKIQQAAKMVLTKYKDWIGQSEEAIQQISLAFQYACILMTGYLLTQGTGCLPYIWMENTLKYRSDNINQQYPTGLLSMGLALSSAYWEVQSYNSRGICPQEKISNLEINDEANPGHMILHFLLIKHRQMSLFDAYRPLPYILGISTLLS